MLSTNENNLSKKREETASECQTSKQAKIGTGRDRTLSFLANVFLMYACTPVCLERRYTGKKHAVECWQMG